MRFLIQLVFIFSSLLGFSQRSVTQPCLSFYTITAHLQPETSTTNPMALFKWDSSQAAYNVNTTFGIEIIKSEICDFVETSLVQFYPITNFLSTPIGSIAISFDLIGSRCSKWRFVNFGDNVNGVKCYTSTSWQNYNVSYFY